MPALIGADTSCELAARSAPGRGGLGCGCFAPAWGAEVVSSNVVGYQKLTIYPEWTMIANPFVVVGENEAPIFNEMFASAKTTVTSGDGPTSSDNLQVWTGSTYTTYYFGNFNGEYGAQYDYVWYDANDDSGEPTQDWLPSGQGAWFKNNTGSQKVVTVTGQVATNDVVVSIGSSWTMLANPFPQDIPLNGDLVDWKAAGTTAGDSPTSSDNIQLWTGNTYKTYYYGNFGGEYGPEYDDVWYDVNDDSGEPTTDSIPFGTAVWYKNSSGTSFNITFQSPVK